MIRFIRGLLLGLLGPIAFVAGVCYWIHRYTGKVPFPVSRPADGELTFQLVYPEEVSVHWARWREGLQPLLGRLQALGSGARARYDAEVQGRLQ